MNKKTLNSKLLQYLLKNAEDIKKEHGSTILTVNHFFAAVLRYCGDISFTGNFSEFGDEKESESLCEMINSYNKSHDTIEALIEILCRKKESYIDDFVFRQAEISAAKITEKSGKEVVTADIFLKSILDNPTNEISKITTLLNGHTDKTVTDHVADVRIKETAEPSMKEDESDAAQLTPEEKAEKTKEKIARLTERVKQIRRNLSSVVFGQDNAIDIFVSGYFQAELRNITEDGGRKPEATYLFAGSPGVGKTYLAEMAAKELGRPFMRFDMSEYTDNEALLELLGTNKSFKDDKEGVLTGFVSKNPRCVLLFDEIEKAHISVIHLFLQVLDAGRLRDTNSGLEVDFSGTIIIFTTNAARKIYEGSETSNLSGISRKTILKALENDVDPRTGKAAFPAAICSRFATGNVVMFNHMEAHTLRRIVENEIKRNVKLIQDKTGISFEVSDDVYSCILFGEGGHADARTVKSRATGFFSSELYELFRLVSGESVETTVTDISKIKISVEIPEEYSISRLFRDDTKGIVLSLGSKDLCGKIDGAVTKRGYKNIVASSFEEARGFLDTQDVEFVFCDFYVENNTELSDELNIEDVDSCGREFFMYVCDSTDVPLYVLSDDKRRYTEEEQFSLIKAGARGFVDVGKPDEVDTAVNSILLKIHQQKSMAELARSSKIVTYESSQIVSDDGKSAEIRLFDLTLETAVDAEDKENILNGLSKPDVKFRDIYGAEGAKEELEFFVEYLKNPKSFSSKGLGVPKGILLYGPPGTGKTKLAKAVAGESDVTFISTEGNSFLKMYRGEGEATVHALFTMARKYAPTIIFIDEIDAIAKERKGDSHSPESILTALLSEMDGFGTDSRKPIFVIAATNFDVEPGRAKSLDPALLRRFDRRIYIGLPDRETRVKYIVDKVAAKPVFNISSEGTENIVSRSVGMSLAQLESVFEFALRIAVRENKDSVDDAVFEEAFETFNHGEVRKTDKTQIELVAYHEAGHAFLCWHSGETPAYLSAVARGNHGGYMRHDANESQIVYTKKALIDKIRVSLGGRASEQIFYGESDGLTTGASADLLYATSLARSVICDYGMDDSLGLASITDEDLSNGAISQQVREAVNKILLNEMQKAKTIIKENRIAVEKIVEELLKKSYLTSAEINAVFSKYAEKVSDL